VWYQVPLGKSWLTAWVMVYPGRSRWSPARDQQHEHAGDARSGLPPLVSLRSPVPSKYSMTRTEGTIGR
jgi:hypothetical protein